MLRCSFPRILTMKTCRKMKHFWSEWVSEWLLFNACSAIVHGDKKNLKKNNLIYLWNLVNLVKLEGLKSGCLLYIYWHVYITCCNKIPPPPFFILLKWMESLQTVISLYYRYFAMLLVKNLPQPHCFSSSSYFTFLYYVEIARR